ncbi:WD40 repeat domain-containing protein [Tautonia rosea]|uniref:WD40 repeat domain-containing protein n=1 Tax=Tautonia rosea TaxID=2728037 RepID=UPI0014728449|nr:WD40 repeat domain-containing protein [Tautonia rosea]
MFLQKIDRAEGRGGFDPHGPSRAGHCAHVSILTPGWCLTVVGVVAAVIGFGEAFDWPGEAGQGARVIGRCKQPISTIAFTPDDSQVATLGATGCLTFWKAEGGGLRAIMGGDDLNIRCFAFDPQGDTVALGCLDGSIRFKDWRTGRDFGRFEGSGTSVQALAFSPDGRWLASAQSKGRLTLWETETGRPLLDLDDHRGAVTALAFSPDSRWLASAGADGVVNLWDAETGVLVASTFCKPGCLKPLVFSADSMALNWASLYEWSVQRWDLGPDGGVRTERCPFEVMVPTPDGRSLLARVDQEELWQLDAETLRVEHRSDFPGRSFCAMAISNDGSRLALGGLSTVEVCRVDLVAGGSGGEESKAFRREQSGRKPDPLGPRAGHPAD